MQCKHCGNTMIDGSLSCELCKRQVRMVPDYSPEDEVLLHQVRSALEQGNEPTPTREQREQTGQLSTREVEMRRRKQAERRRIARKKQQIVVVSMLVAVLLLLGGIGYVIYTNSYAGIINKADKFRIERNYDAAVNSYEKAINKKPSSTLAYETLANLHIDREQIAEAEAVVLSGVSANKEMIEMYHMVIDFYLELEMYESVMPFLNQYKKQAVLNKLTEYIVEQPEYSLEEDTYDDVREVSLTSVEEKIYYVVNGGNATTSDEVYDGPIQISEGTTEVSFIAVNELGITSVPLTKTYVVELPIEGAPVVSPSTGQYNEATEIRVQVPNGYSAYYTTDGTVPNEASEKYVGPIDMAEGNTIFSVVLINASGRASDVTKRNYELVLE